MKKLLCTLALALALVCLLASCNTQSEAPSEPAKPTIEISNDGYVVVNGEKTEHKVHTEPVISVINGYVAINGVKTEYKVDTPDVIEVDENGYLVVNGVKTDYVVSQECNHLWETVTTPATCMAGGYDTITCKLCDKSVITNETAKLDHVYSTTYSSDLNYHWFKCTNCDAVTGKEFHTADANDCCTVCLLPVSHTVGVLYGISADGTYAMVIGYTGTATKVRIAEEYNGLPVKVIYREAFKNLNITSVVIPDSVKSIGDYAFVYCFVLTSVTIGDSVTSIGDYAFRECTSLASVTIPNSVTSIGEGAFSGCTSLTSVTIPDSVTSIGNRAFDWCTSLTSVTIPDSVTSIGNYAFYWCTSLTSVTIGDSLKSIGYAAFYGCTSLTSVTFVNPNGWWYANGANATSGMAIAAESLADPAPAAQYLKSTYLSYYWYRTE